jgi:Na+-transporting NADH:ubiquinone oxidoreductase subunit B
MKALRNYLDKIKPNFEEGGKFHAFRSVFDGFETFLFVPNATSKSGTHIHDSIDSKRIMSMVVIALVPALLFGMYNVGYQHFHATGATGGFWEMFIYGFLAVLPKIIVSYVVGLGIEFVVAQWKKEEIQEGFLVSGILIPMIVPVDCPLWILAVATAFSVIFAKEVFGGTGMNVFNVALITRAFLFFAYPTKMSGDAVWVSGDSIFGLGQSVDGLTVATPLGAAATSGAVPEFSWDMVTGLIPGSIGETSVIAIALGAILLLLLLFPLLLSALASVPFVPSLPAAPCAPLSPLAPFMPLVPFKPSFPSAPFEALPAPPDEKPSPTDSFTLLAMLSFAFENVSFIEPGFVAA